MDFSQAQVKALKEAFVLFRQETDPEFLVLKRKLN
jgi:hypothetical protein